MKKIMLSSIVLLFTFCANSQQAFTYKPDDQKLYDTIAKLDSIFFGLYNNCATQLQAYADFYTDSLEFYHDRGGLSTSKKDVVEGTKKNICGKVTRELIKGSIEVYPIKDYGAVEIGLHLFHNSQEKQNGPPKVSKFIIFWQHSSSGWKIAKVVSLH